MNGFRKLYRSSNLLALEKSVLHFIDQSKTNSPLSPIYILVPNHYIGAHLQHELALIRSHMNVSFETMSNFAKRLLFTDPIFLGKRKLTPEMELLQISDICRKVLAETQLEPIADKRGFHKNLVSLFHHVIDEKLPLIPTINSKTKLFQRVFAQYLELKNAFYHDRWMIEIASQHPISIPGGVAIYGFEKLSKLERSFLNHVSKSTTIDLWLEIYSSNSFQTSTLEWVDFYFQQVDDLIPFENQPKIIVQPCFHMDDEGMWISKTITDQQMSKPISFHRFGIFYNDSEHLSLIENALQKSQIPYVSLEGQRFSKTRMGIALQLLIEILQTNWSRDQWFEFLEIFPWKTTYMADYGEPSEWSRISIESGISNRSGFILDRLDAYSTRHPKVRNFVDFHQLLMEDFVEIEKWIEKVAYKKVVECLVRWIQKYAEPASVPEILSIYFEELQYIAKDAPSKLAWSEFQSLMLEKLDRCSFSETIFESDGVFLAPISMMKCLSFDVVFWPHVNEGCFPKMQNANFDLHQEEIQTIAAEANLYLKSSEEDFEIQNSLFQSLSDHATQNIYLSYAKYSIPNEDDLKPSYLLHSFSHENVLKPQETRTSLTDAHKVRSQEWIAAYEDRQWSTFNAYVDRNLIHKEIYSASELSKYATCPKQYFLRHILGLVKGDYLENEFQMMAKDRGSLVHHMMFRFFMTLKTKSLLPIRKQTRDLLRKELSEVCKTTLSYHKIHHSYGIPELWNLDENQLVDDLLEYIDREMIQSGYWNPTAFELRFGMKNIAGQEDDPNSIEQAIELSLLHKKLKFKGKIDRIDLSHDKTRMRVVDYKTGQVMDTKSWRYGKGENIQIPLYVLLAQHIFPNLALEEIEGKLISLQSYLKFDERTISKNQILSHRQELYSLLELLDEGVQSGVFFPNPGNSGQNCRYCDFQRVCGKDISQVVEDMPETDFMKLYAETKDQLP